jgi:hypothetical protein
MAHCPRGSFANLLFSEFSDRPIDALKQLYDDLGLTWTGTAQSKIAAYLARKPKGVFWRASLRNLRPARGAQ